MKNIFKILAWFLFFTGAAIIAIMAYWNRDQQLNLSKTLPDAFEHCGSIINRDSAEYIELKNWLYSNQEDWNNTPVSYIQKDTYISDAISVNVVDNSVVVNYKNHNGTWNQVTRQKKSNELISKCTKK